MKSIRESIKKNAHDVQWHFSDEESPADLHARAVKFLDSLAGRNEEHILAVTHGLFIKMIGAHILLGEYFKPEYFHDFTQKIGSKKTGITLLSYSDGQWVVETWNDKAHLG